MSTRSSSLVTRTRLSMLAVAGISVAVVFVVFYAAWLRYTVDYRTTELGRQVSALATGLSAGGQLGSGDSGATGELRVRLFRVQAGLIGARLVVTDDEGVVLLSSEKDTAKSYDLGVLGEADERGVRTAVAALGGGRAVVVAAPVEGEQGGYLLALQPVREINGAQAGVLVLLGISALIATVVAWLTGGLVARRLSGRVLRLEQGAEAVARGEWGRQVDVEGEDEVASLARSFNRMSTRVSDVYRAQKEFVGNVSHELRTPITTISGFAGAMLDGTATEPDVRHRFLTGIRDEAGRLAELTQTLLVLADIDSGRLELDEVVVDTGALAEALRSRHEAVAGCRDIEFLVDDLSCDGQVPLGDESRLLQIASALTANAIAYTPEGGQVRISSSCEDDRWSLLVDDSGSGVPVEQRERIFERFVRLDPSRCAETGGSGLGLSICARLVELMDGTIRVDDSPFGGSRFVVSLPAYH
ncbi:MAG: HAMP domain-containing sensor histidine kinase [Coriobacteriia bacterium]|nr:HAMP domain-containing sensor histidine kinase [Coriobacteriia bacterium]